MKILEISTFTIYFAILVIIALITSKKQKSDTDFVIGGRSLNYWLTALSAQASDMSSWLFMGYPMLIFLNGVYKIWAAVGLVVFMFLNWHFIAPKIRHLTGKMNNLTMYAYFESRVKDNSAIIRTLSAVISLVFYLIYITSGLMALGFLVESLFGLHYLVGISIGLLIVVFYVFLGGYTTVAWIDLVQGFFLLGVILYLPIVLLIKIGGFETVFTALQSQKLSTSLLPDFSAKTFFDIIFLAAGWGLGYFGQPHIITKFMGISDVKLMPKAKYVGISWQILALIGSTILGLIGIVIFKDGLANPQLVVLDIVKTTLSPFFAGLVLCAILAATTNVMAAQILVVASSLAEDFYKAIFAKKASHKQVLKASRICVIVVGLISYFIAYFNISTIYALVLYAWSGLGSAFGPLLLISLYYKKVTRLGAFMGILTGGVIAGIWPYFNKTFGIDLPPMIPGFILSSVAIYLFSLTKEKQKV